jgi:hypothetical protein
VGTKANEESTGVAVAEGAEEGSGWEAQLFEQDRSRKWWTKAVQNTCERGRRFDVSE